MPPPPNPMEGTPAHILTLLDRLHAESLEQERGMDRSVFAGASTEEDKKAAVRDKFIALDQDKAQFVYALCRAVDARTIVEAGTSFGVSTIYLALAASRNAAASNDGRRGNVVATEWEASKAARAREYWAECGEAVTGAIELREGDLLETLRGGLEDVDLLLLDSMFLVLPFCPFVLLPFCPFILCPFVLLSFLTPPLYFLTFIC